MNDHSKLVDEIALVYDEILDEKVDCGVAESAPGHITRQITMPSMFNPCGGPRWP